MGSTVLERLRRLLDEHSVKYEVMEHQPVFTSEQAARVRGTPIMCGAKALVCKTGRRFSMFALPAGLKLDTRAVRSALRIQRLRFATETELTELTGLAPGCVPPFGSLFGLPTYCDNKLASNPSIYFSAGAHTVSVSMKFADYARIESPKQVLITR
jgi:Ala-tRNA(Pro) deacylase